MKVKEVEWTRNKCVNYQSRKATVKIELEDGDSAEAAIRRAQALVDLALGEAPTDAEVERARAVLERRRLVDEAR